MLYVFNCYVNLAVSNVHAYELSINGRNRKIKSVHRYLCTEKVMRYIGVYSFLLNEKNANITNN